MRLEIKVYKSIPLVTMALMEGGESMSLAFNKQYIDRFFYREGREYEKLLVLFNIDYGVRIQNCVSIATLISSNVSSHKDIKEVAESVFTEKYSSFFYNKILKLKQMFSQYIQDIDEIIYI